MVKGKEKGRYFEAKIRDKLKKLGYYVYTKGVSTKGVDIFAIKDNNLLLIELKTFKDLSNLHFVRELQEKLEEEYKKVKDATDCFNIFLLIIIEDRQKKIFHSFLKKEGNNFWTSKLLSNKSLEYVLNPEKFT
ncbi:MAG: hypothetical protein ABGW69_02160 [Nanoarchaeota archaeon]